VERTHEQHIAANMWAQYGDAHFVRKVGSRWTVAAHGVAVPLMFRTKREALTAVLPALKAFLEER
jgi:hypothetical protein